MCALSMVSVSWLAGWLRGSAACLLSRAAVEAACWRRITTPGPCAALPCPTSISGVQITRGLS